MSLSLMQLETCWQTHLIIRTWEAESKVPLEEKSSEVEMKLSFDVMKHKTKPEFRVPMKISFTWKDNAKSPFEAIAIGLVGIFRFPKDTDEEEMKKYVPLLCLTNLYGYARGIVAQATGSYPGGPFYMPLVNMHDVIVEAHTNEEKAESHNP